MDFVCVCVWGGEVILLSNKIPTSYYGTHRVITMFAKVCHWILYGGSTVVSMPSHHVIL